MSFIQLINFGLNNSKSSYGSLEVESYAWMETEDVILLDTVQNTAHTL
jgi:hypothetical protein